MTEADSERDNRQFGYIGTFLRWVAILSVICFTDVNPWLKGALIGLLAIREVLRGILPGTDFSVSSGRFGLGVRHGLEDMRNSAEIETVRKQPKVPQISINSDDEEDDVESNED